MNASGPGRKNEKKAAGVQLLSGAYSAVTCRSPQNLFLTNSFHKTQVQCTKREMDYLRKPVFLKLTLGMGRQRMY